MKIKILLILIIILLILNLGVTAYRDPIKIGDEKLSLAPSTSAAYYLKSIAVSLRKIENNLEVLKNE